MFEGAFSLDEAHFTIPSRKHAYIILTPLNTTFIQSKLGFTGVYIIFLFLLKSVDCGYLLELPRHNLCFEQKYEKYQSFLSENFQFLEVKFSIYLNRHVFVMPKVL